MFGNFKKEGIEKMGNTLTPLFLVLAIVVMSIFGTYHFIGMSEELKEANSKLNLSKDALEIDITNSQLSSVDEFTAAVITNKYMDMYNKSFGSKVLGFIFVPLDKVEFVWKFDYRFSFGVKFPAEWDYKLTIIDESLGHIKIQIPEPILISKNPPSPELHHVIRGIDEKNNKMVLDQLKLLATVRVNYDANAYLKNEDVRKTIKLALANRIMSFANLNRPKAQRITEIDIEFVDANQLSGIPYTKEQKEKYKKVLEELERQES
jgi:hypothetical protein